MNWVELKYATRAAINELSSRGTILPVTKVADLEKQLKYFINPLLFELASTTGKLAATKSYVLNPVDNALGMDTSAIKLFSGTDFIVEQIGARAYWFECTGPATVYVEEQRGGVWLNLETITTQAGDEFSEHKGLIAPQNTANKVRLRFSGTVPYSFRNYKLYGYPWTAADQIQQNRPDFRFDAPADFLKLNQMMIRRDARQFVPFNDYKWQEPDCFWVNRYYGAIEIVMKYWRKPTVLAWTEPEDIDPAATIDATADAVQILPLGLAAKAMIAAKDETSGMVLQNLWEAAKAQLPGNDGNYAGAIVPRTEW